MRELAIYPSSPILTIQEAETLEVNTGCTQCPLAEKVRTVCMSPELDKGDRSKGTVYILGGGPGETEDRHSRPNVGTAGKYIRKTLEKIWAGAVVYDNAVRCAPGAKKVTAKMLAACRGYVAQTINEAAPDRIICMGAAAIASVIGHGFQPSSVRKGYTYLNHLSGPIPVFFLLHPLSALRNRFLLGQFEEDLEWALTATPPGVPLGAVSYMVDTEEAAHKAVADLQTHATCTWDIESFGAPFNSDHVILNLAVTPEDEDYAYVWETQQLESQVARPIFDYLKTAPSGGANIKFDVVSLRAKYGVHAANIVFDTQLWRRLLDSDALAALAVQQTMVGMAGGKDEVGAYIKAGVKELRLMVRKPELKPKLFKDLPQHLLLSALERIDGGDNPKRYAYAAIPPDIRSAYNGRDSISSDKVRSLLQSRFDARPDLFAVWEKVGREMNYAFTVMEYNGIAVDREKLLQLQSLMALRIDEIGARLKQYGTEEDPFNPNSFKQVGELLFNRLGLKSEGETKGGGYKTDAETLDRLDHPVARDIVAIRSATKFKSNYADGMLEHTREDGRIHPNYKVAGTGTGRPSCSDPNLLNVPRGDSPEGKLCRDVFVAPPGYVFIEMDYSQIEVRVAAMLSGEPLMIQFYKDDRDFHLETAKLIAPIFGLNPDDITKEHILRSQAKTVVFACVSMDTKILTKRGWLSYDEVKVGDETKGRTGWVRVTKKVHYKDAPVVDWRGFRVTPKHRWWTERRTGRNTNSHTGKPTAKGRYYVEEMTALNEITTEHRIRLAHPLEQEDRSGLTVQEAGVLGWLLTDGHFGDKQNVSIYQSFRVNQPKCDEIQKLLIDVPHKVYNRESSGMRQYSLLNRPAWRKLARSVTEQTVIDMGHEQRQAFTHAAMLAEGYKGGSGAPRWCQNPGPIADLFMLAFHLNGHFVRAWPRMGHGKYADRAHLVMSIGRPHITGQRLKYEDAGTEDVWCVQTEDETWTMKRGHSVALTGNTLYGDPAAGLAMKLNVTVKMAKKLQDAILGKYKHLKAWIAARLKFARQNGYCRTWWDGQDFRERALTGIADSNQAVKDTSERSAWNTPIQGTATDFTNKSLGELQRWLEDDYIPAKLVLTVYDSILLEVRDDVIQEAVTGMRSIMTNHPVLHEVPLKVDVKIGKSWGSMRDWEGA